MHGHMYRRLHLQVRRDDERGVVAVWVALTLVVLLGFAGWAVDFSHWNDERAHMQKAADAAALAGAVYLPDDPAGAIAAARSIASQNGYPSGVSVTTLASANQLKVTINTTVKSSFAQAIGVGNANLSKHAISEYESPKPLDMVLVFDRTGSMGSVPANSPSGTQLPIANAKDAALDLLKFLNPKRESIALTVLPPSSTMTTCTGASAGAFGIRGTTVPPDVGGANTTWVVSPYPSGPLENDYKNADGTLNTSSQIVKTVNCLQAAGSTDLGDPIEAAATYLKNNGRPGAKKGIIFMTDGAANLPLSLGTPALPVQPCSYANTKAAAVKASGIQVITIGFLSDNPGVCEKDTSGAFKNATVTSLLASMASPVKGVPADNNGCTQAENTDGDNFFCQPSSGDLSSVFVAAAAQLAGRVPRIIE